MEFKLPGAQLTLIGRSRAADATAFWIPELNLCLDAGVVVHSQKPSHILITHTHSDHCSLLTHMMSRSKPPTVAVPFEAAALLETYLRSYQDVTACAPIADEDYQCNHVIQGVRGGDEFLVGNMHKVRCYAMQHSIPCVGYGVFAIRKGLKPEYAGLPGRELAALRKEGVEIEATREVPLFLFNGDTSANVFRTTPELLQFPVVITECSFFTEGKEDKAGASGHTHWTELREVVRSHPDVLFVLTHFSLVYSAHEIRDFFEEQAKTLPNIHVMLQLGPDPITFGSTRADRRVD